MIKRLNDGDISRFEEICRELSTPFYKDGESIGTYNEKRLHRAIKKFLCEDESCYEVKVGSSVADVLCDGTVYEIQTGSFYPLTKKIATYLSSSEYEIRVIYPIISKRRITRVEKDTGELLRSRMSSAKQSPSRILPELIYLADSLKSRRLSFEIYSICAEERRYSDTVYRYRKSGRRDSELFPVSLEEITVLETTDDFAALLPDKLLSMGEFCAADFARATGIGGRRAYLALGALCALGVLSKEKEGRNAARFRVV